MPHLSRTVKIVGALATVAVLSGGVAVAASPSLRSGPKTPIRTPQIVGTASPSQTGYVPLTPCRIVDTRVAGGPITGTFTRTFAVGGTTGFSSQGGKSTGCGVPLGASTVALDVTTTQSATGNGFLTLYADGTARPNSNQTSYLKGQNITTLVNAPVNTTTGKVDVYAYKTTHVVIDVAGYYREPIAANVRFDGIVLAKSAQVVSVTHPETGQYVITFGQDITNCAATATGSRSYTNVGVTPITATVVDVYVRDVDSTPPGPLTDDNFSLTMTC